MVAIMFGTSSRFAEEPKPGRDEDNLDREDDGGHFDNGDGPTNTLDLLYERLKQGDDTAGHAAMSIARCIIQAWMISPIVMICGQSG